MVNIDTEKCIGCGRCVKDCFSGVIRLENGRAVSNGKKCMECGHCIAVCPRSAVTLDGYDMSEVCELKGLDCTLDPVQYLNHLKARRSIRRFTSEPVTEEQLRTIIEAGRYSPTGSNLQNVSYYVSRQDINGLKSMVYGELKSIAEASAASGVSASKYCEMWLKMYDEFTACGRDKLFFDAGTVIVISSDSPQSACIAAAHMETMVYSLGLGMLYSGFTTRAVTYSDKLKDYLRLKPGYNVYAVLVVGHPDVKYERTVPRKAPDMIWN